MSGDDLGRLAYLVLLGLAVGGWFLAENRKNLGKTARQAAVWGLIFVGVIAAVGLWSDIRDDVLTRQSVVSERAIEVARARDGHYYLVARLNDVPVRFVVDTGATDVVLTREDARRVGIDLNSLVFSGSAGTANGMVRTAYARVGEMRLGSIVDDDVPVAVNRGEMDSSLLGMAYLGRFGRIEISGNKLLLER
jgi:aspartyl protease family protein